MVLKFFASLLIVLILFSNNKGLVYWLEYKLNYEYIVKNLCVERETRRTVAKDAAI
ncbi:MAG: hypothetical protein ACP5RR_07810 [Candidatus Kapaibacteriota bacterium]|jgi:hypothetical protein